MTTEFCTCWHPVSAVIDKLECTVHLSEAVPFVMDLLMLQVSPVLLMVGLIHFTSNPRKFEGTFKTVTLREKA